MTTAERTRPIAFGWAFYVCKFPGLKINPPVRAPDLLGNFCVSIPDQALNDFGPRRYRGMGPPQIVQLLQGVNVHADRDCMIHESAPSCDCLSAKLTYANSAL